MTPDEMRERIEQALGGVFDPHTDHADSIVRRVMAVVAPALEEVERGRDEWAAMAKGYVDAIQERDRLIQEVRAALGAAQAERDDVLTDARACHALMVETRVENEALRAAVERVWALCDKSDRLLPGSVPSPGYLATWQVRAAMDGEPGDKEEA